MFTVTVVSLPSVTYEFVAGLFALFEPLAVTEFEPFISQVPEYQPATVTFCFPLTGTVIVVPLFAFTEVSLLYKMPLLYVKAGELLFKSIGKQ